MGDTKSRSPASPARDRYYIRFTILFVIYGLLLAGTNWLFVHNPPEGMLRYGLALAPAVPLVAIIAALALYLKEETDEFARFLCVVSMLWGLGITLAVTTVWGFLEAYVQAPRLPLFLIFPLFCAGMGVSQPFIFWRYR